MTVRTFKQHGQGYGLDPVHVIAKLDGVEIFNGPVDTVDEPFPMLPDPTVDITTTLFSWEDLINFVGTKSLEITVTGGKLLLTNTLANYGIYSFEDESPDSFTAFYQSEDSCIDPFSNVIISGQPKSADHTELSGQWYWTLPAGSTFSCNVSIQAGKVV
jgi:hypothetical protein